VLLACLVGLAAGCHHGLVYDPGPKPSVGGTIARIAMTTDETVRLPGRKISAIEGNGIALRQHDRFERRIHHQGAGRGDRGG
jgi:hypothetical protein